MTFFNMLLQILSAALPLIVLIPGALASEYAGVMAVFLDGIMNMASFLAYAFSVFTKSVFAGCIISVFVSAAFMTLIAVFAEKTRANHFICGISVNLFSEGFVSFCSAKWFGTKGVVYGFGENLFGNTTAQIGLRGMIVPCIVFACCAVIALERTPWGLRTRIAGSDPDLLRKRGLSPESYRIMSWTLAALCAAVCGVLFTLRLSSYVPGVSAGKGWIALAAVFLGSRKPKGALAAGLVFAAAEYAAGRLNTEGTFLTPTLVLALPYCAALVLFVVVTSLKSCPKKLLLRPGTGRQQ